MKSIVVIVLMLMYSLPGGAQSMDSTRTGKGSYSSFGKLDIEDNSFLLEEAFNQDPGVIQYIFTTQSLASAGTSLVYAFTQEMALGSIRHQFSYTLPYEVQHVNFNNANYHGFGDLRVHYRYQVLDEHDFIMFIPRVSLIFPTGNSSHGLGAGAWGTEVNAAITKRISAKVVTHYNFGLTHYHNGDYYSMDNGSPLLQFERNLLNRNAGAGVVVYPYRWLNILMESMVESESAITPEGKVTHSSRVTLSPGFRLGFTSHQMQVVTGFGLPVYFENSQYHNTGLFFYISFERVYQP